MACSHSVTRRAVRCFPRVHCRCSLPRLTFTPRGNNCAAGQNVTCPVSGESFIAPADEDAHVVQFNHGQVVYVCCPGCIEKLKANLTHYIDSLPKVSAPVNFL